MRMRFSMVALVISLTIGDARASDGGSPASFAADQRIVYSDGLHSENTEMIRFRGRILLVHVLKNIMIPVVTVVGLELGNMIAFAVVTETVFAWPGIGKLLIDSIGLLDRPVIVAYLMLTVLMFIFINFTVDILYSLLDPRVRLVEAKP